MFVFKELDYLTDGEIDLILEEKITEDISKGYVPAYLYKITLHGKVEEIGGIVIRIGHNENIDYAGNLVVAIDERFRGNYYAAKACQVIKEVAKAHDMSQLTITCNPDNDASIKTCMKIGATLKGIFEVPTHTELYQDGERQKCIYIWNL